MPKFEDINILSGKIVDSAIYVHRQLGSGLLESAYQKAFEYILTKRRISFEREKFISVKIDDHEIENAFRADFIIDKSIIVEIKSVSSLLPIHSAQLLTYMKLSKCSLGLLLNFNVPLMKDGIKRMRL